MQPKKKFIFPSMTTGRYIIESGNHKFECPKCGKKSFKRFIDTETGSYPVQEYGICDHKTHCQYQELPQKETKFFFMQFVEVVDYNAKSLRCTDGTGKTDFLPKSQVYQRQGNSLWIPEFCLKGKKFAYSSNPSQWISSDGQCQHNTMPVRPKPRPEITDPTLKAMYNSLQCVTFQGIAPKTFGNFLSDKAGVNISKDKFSGRIHTPVVGLEKSHRRNILIQGEKTAGLDVVTMQPLLLAKVLLERIGANEFTDWIYEGKDVYLLVQDKAGLKTRDEAKGNFFQILFSKPDQVKAEIFDNAAWLQWVNDYKTKPEPLNPQPEEKLHNNLAWLLQSLEVQIMQKVWNMLIEQNIPFLSIHDEVIIKESDIQRAEDCYNAVFRLEFPYFKITKKIKPDASYIDPKLFERSLAQYESNNFITCLDSLFDEATVKRLILRYRIGTSKHRFTGKDYTSSQGACIFWQIDITGRIRTGTIMLFNPETRHRVTNPYTHITYVHCLINQPDYALKQCFFGEHLLSLEPTKIVVITESDKAAIIASAYMPQYNWISAGNKDGLKDKEKCKVLTGRKVILFPDLGAYDDWKKQADILKGICSISVSKVLEENASDKERIDGLDIADFLVRYPFTSRPKSEQKPVRTDSSQINCSNLKE